MIKNVILNKTSMPALLKSLDAGMLRARVIANNIANVTTPEFKRVEVSFEEELRRALDKTRLSGTRTDNKHLLIGKKDVSSVKPKAYKPVDPTLPSGVNNVDIDMEMAKLAENQLIYNFGIKFLKGTYSKINASIQGKSLQIQ